MTNSCSPRKFRSRNKKLNLPSIHPPDCVVIMDTERKSSVIEEASRLEIPIVGLVDSSMPWETFKKITYPVPANDSVQFVYLFCNMISKTFLYEQKKLAALKGIDAKEDEVEVVKKDEQEVLLENGYDILTLFFVVLCVFLIGYSIYIVLVYREENIDKVTQYGRVLKRMWCFASTKLFLARTVYSAKAN